MEDRRIVLDQLTFVVAWRTPVWQCRPNQQTSHPAILHPTRRSPMEGNSYVLLPRPTTTRSSSQLPPFCCLSLWWSCSNSGARTYFAPLPENSTRADDRAGRSSNRYTPVKTEKNEQMSCPTVPFSPTKEYNNYQIFRLKLTVLLCSPPLVPWIVDRAQRPYMCSLFLDDHTKALWPLMSWADLPVPAYACNLIIRKTLDLDHESYE